MSPTIPQRELRNDNARVIDRVVAGESFVVTRHGVPVAELRPLSPATRTVVATSSLAAVLREGPRVDAGRFRADLDAVIDPGL
ncbi:MAG TPA: type II toxin-antitoxin system prevent-host-death family antitoxin [Acidimicrobiales bacterium]|nr:type II toxin-antitoxin system prevent-host-death family antitoxin [Acidimicrobiales bacterium]